MAVRGASPVAVGVSRNDFGEGTLPSYENHCWFAEAAAASLLSLFFF